MSATTTITKLVTFQFTCFLFCGFVVVVVVAVVVVVVVGFFLFCFVFLHRFYACFKHEQDQVLTMCE